MHAARREPRPPGITRGPSVNTVCRLSPQRNINHTTILASLAQPCRSSKPETNGATFSTSTQARNERIQLVSSIVVLARNRPSSARAAMGNLGFWAHPSVSPVIL